MIATLKFTRRDFLRHTGVGAGAVVFGAAISFPEPAEAIAGLEFRKLLKDGFTLNPWVAIKLDGTIIIQAFRSEMGQGIKSSLAAVLADELEANWCRVRVEQADADGPRFAIANSNPGGTPSWLISDEVSQFADSSRSMAIYYEPMRLFGAAIRLVFTRGAIKKWNCDPNDAWAEQHHVYCRPGGRLAKGEIKHSIAYNHLLLEALQVPLPGVPEIKAALKKPDEWRFIGKTMPFIDAHDMVTGKAVYGADVHLPGMLTAMIERCPVANGEVKSYDDSETRKVPGVVDVIKVRLPGLLPAGGVGAGFVPHAGVAVLAETTWAALQGRRKLKVEWDLSSPAAAFHAGYDSAAFRRELEASTAQPGKLLRDKGDVDKGFAAAARVVEADYYVPHLAQAPMEPPAAVAVYKDGQFEVWSPTQGPEITQHYVGLAMMEENPVEWLVWQALDPCELKECEQEERRVFNEKLAALLGISVEDLYVRRDRLKKTVRDKVKVHVTLLGGGFGRKSQPDYALEAAFLAKARPGTPIRVQWTREDDIQFSYFHTVSNQRLKAGLDASGKVTSWLQRSAFPSFFATLFPPPPAPEIFQAARAGYVGGGEYPYGAAIERAQGLEDLPFDVDNIRLENCKAESHVRLGWMRSVSNIFHAFAIGSFVNELAIAAGHPNPKDHLLELIGAGRVIDLEAEGVTCFDNNGFASLKFGGNPPVLPPYPPDSRRLRAVVERVAADSDWDAKWGRLPPGHGLGIAAHRSFLSYVAIVAHVSLNEARELTVQEIWGAIDCGFAVNPDRVRAQMEGGILYGLSYALLGRISCKDGRVVQHNFDDYPVLRIHQAPRKISVSIVTGKTEILKACKDGAELHEACKDKEPRPTGAGEPPTPAVAPAIANAIVAAGGPRLRDIPFFCESQKIIVL